MNELGHTTRESEFENVVIGARPVLHPHVPDRPLAWLLSRIMFDLIPLRLIPTIIVSTIVYFMVGLNSDAARFFKCLLIFVEYSLALTLFVSTAIEVP